MKLPWKKRAEKAHQDRLEAEKKYEEVQKDWDEIREHRDSIDQEIELNDWTRTAIKLFSSPPTERLAEK